MTSDAAHGRDMAKLSNAERLARAVLLFHDASPWGASKSELWLALTGERAATTRVLCDLARRVRSEEEETK
jgi:hypothetical protein